MLSEAVTPATRASCTPTCTDRSPSLPEKRFVQAASLRLPPYLEPLKKQSEGRGEQSGTLSEQREGAYGLYRTICPARAILSSLVGVQPDRPQKNLARFGLYILVHMYACLFCGSMASN